MLEIINLGARELAQKIKQKSLSPIEIMDKTIQYIEKVNPKINAVIVNLFDQAMEKAKAAEATLMKSSTELPPLFGVPFSIKEMIGIKDQPYTLGSLYRKDDKAKFDSTTYQRLIAAGAIPVGMTNIPEFGLWMESNNKIYGRTNNPYDLSRTPGGSSGGEGALLGSGAVSFGVGSDVGGSIRMPAFFCGIFAHKPTNKMIPLTGHYPLIQDVAHEYTEPYYPYTVIGPLSKKSGDLSLLMNLLSGQDGYDPYAGKYEYKHFEKINWKDVKVYTCPSPHIHLTRTTSEELQNCVTDAADALTQLGATVEELDPKLFNDSYKIWSNMLGASKKSDIQTLMGGGEPIKLLKEFISTPLNKSNNTLPALIYCLFDKAKLTKLDPEKSLQQGYALRKRLEDLLKPNAILLIPPHPRIAPKHNHAILEPFNFAYTAIFNVMKFPVTSAPMGLNSQNLPLGVQIVSARGNDHLTIAAAEVIEVAFGGWVKPKNI